MHKFSGLVFQMSAKTKAGRCKHLVAFLESFYVLVDSFNFPG